MATPQVKKVAHEAA
uniref:Uncharacterized protein n=1 Tax=Arundo donax TaxID=35708 RepID=A0A0A9FM73_ARUDO